MRNTFNRVRVSLFVGYVVWGVFFNDMAVILTAVIILSTLETENKK